MKNSNEKIDLILDSGRSNIGLESTVVDVTNNIKILRPGSIGIKEISKVLGKKFTLLRVQIKQPLVC